MANGKKNILGFADPQRPLFDPRGKDLLQLLVEAAGVPTRAHTKALTKVGIPLAKRAKRAMEVVEPQKQGLRKLKEGIETLAGASGIASTIRPGDPQSMATVKDQLLRFLANPNLELTTGQPRPTQTKTQPDQGQQQEAAQPQFDEKILDPANKAALQAVKKAKTEQVNEALAQGVPPEFIQNQIIQESQLTQAQDQQTVLEAVFNLLGFRKPKAEVLREQLLEQQLRGEIPLQAGEREKLEMAQFNNLLTTGNKAVSAETSKLIANVDSGLQQVNLLEQAFNVDPNAFRQLATPGNAQAQSVKIMIEDLSDIIGRLRSGGAINKDEEKRFKNQIPKFGFIKGRLEAPGAVKFKLDKLRALFNRVKTLSEPKQSGLSEGIQAALQAGYTREEIMARLKSKGML